MSRLTESTLQPDIEASKKGKRRAQRRLYDFTYARLLNASLRYAKDYEEAQWIFNHAMLKIFSSLGRYESNTNYLGWARSIIVKTSIDYLRKRTRNQWIITSVEEAELESQDYELNTALSNLETADIIQMVQSLPDRERMIFSMYEIDGYSHVEIEKETAINRNTSKWLLAQAKKKLKKTVQETGELKICINE